MLDYFIPTASWMSEGFAKTSVWTSLLSILFFCFHFFNYLNYGLKSIHGHQTFLIGLSYHIDCYNLWIDSVKVNSNVLLEVPVLPKL